MTHDDARVAIERAGLDDIEGWYDGDAERMRRSLHPDLAKRKVRGLASRPQLLSVTRRM